MKILFFIFAGIIFAYWLFGMSQPRYNKPMIFRNTKGIYGILIAAAFFVFLGCICSR